MLHTTYSGKPRKNKYISRTASQSSLFFHSSNVWYGSQEETASKWNTYFHLSCTQALFCVSISARIQFSECNCTSEWATCFKMCYWYIAVYSLDSSSQCLSIGWIYLGNRVDYWE